MKRPSRLPVLRTLMPLALACGLIAGCNSSAPSSPFAPTGPNPPVVQPVNSDFTLAPGESVSISAARIEVHFRGVVSDSRCPGDAMCVTQGDAVLAFDVAVSSVGTQYQMKHPNQVPLQFGPYRLELREVSPYPFHSLGPIPPANYRATLRVTSRS